MSNDKSTKFVAAVCKVVQGENTSLRARLSRADNASTEYQSWNFLSQWTNIEESRSRSYALIAASIARAKHTGNGTTKLGRALYVISSKSQGVSNDERDSARLRRILSSQSSEELIDVLRPILRYIVSQDIVLDYEDLLTSVLYFDFEDSRERTKARWAQEFYTTEVETN